MVCKGHLQRSIVWRYWEFWLRALSGLIPFSRTTGSCVNASREADAWHLQVFLSLSLSKLKWAPKREQPDTDSTFLSEGVILYICWHCYSPICGKQFGSPRIFGVVPSVKMYCPEWWAFGHEIRTRASSTPKKDARCGALRHAVESALVVFAIQHIASAVFQSPNWLSISGCLPVRVPEVLLNVELLKNGYPVSDIHDVGEQFLSLSFSAAFLSNKDMAGWCG